MKRRSKVGKPRAVRKAAAAKKKPGTKRKVASKKTAQKVAKASPSPGLRPASPQRGEAKRAPTSPVGESPRGARLRGRRRGTPRKRAAPQRTPADLERLLRRERRLRRKLEHQLTDLVRELGQVRLFEAQARALEQELARRDEELAELRSGSPPRESVQVELPLS